MSRRIIAVMLIIAVCLTLFALPAAAAEKNVKAEYTDGAVSIAGTGFQNDTGYTIRVVDIESLSVKAMGQAKADGSGNISASILTGVLRPLENYVVYVNRPDGSLEGQDESIGVESLSQTEVIASYSQGVLVVSGTGFITGTGYTVRVVDIRNLSLKAMGQAAADGTGRISASILTGVLGPLEDYIVYVNHPDGTLAGIDASIQGEQVSPLYTATIRAETGGRITTGLSGNYAAGAEIHLAASANSGYSFSRWASAGGGVFEDKNSPATTFIMPSADVTITAYFTYNDPGSGSDSDGDTASAPASAPVSAVTVKQMGGTAIVFIVVTANTDEITGMAGVRIGADVASALVNAAKAAEASGQKVVVEIKVDAGESAKAVEVEIPVNAFRQIADISDSDGIKVDVGMCTVTFDSAALHTIKSVASEGDIRIGISMVDKSTLNGEAREKVGDRPVYDFTVEAGDTEINDLAGGKAQISIPYIPGPEENEEAIVAYFVKADGSLQAVRGRYDPQTRTVKFIVAHFSVYAVGYNEIAFIDVAFDVWYSKAAGFMGARGITPGIGDGRFMPGSNVSRADFLIMVMRGYGLEPDTGAGDNFADAGNKYYTPYLAAAKRWGLVTGTGNNRYAPEEAISRQDMFAILYRALKVLKELPAGSGGGKLEDFADSVDIAGYAREAIELFVETGSIQGDGRYLTPKAASTRAQAAQVLYNLLSK